MSMKLICDRCGTEIPPKDQDVSGRVRVIAGATQLKQMDLCAHDRDELLKQLDKFLRH